MQDRAVKLAVVLFLAAGMAVARAAGRATPGASPGATAGESWRKDSAAREFFSFGVRCAKGAGPGGLDLLRAAPIIEAHAAGGRPSVT